MDTLFAYILSRYRNWNPTLQTYFLSYVIRITLFLDWGEAQLGPWARLEVVLLQCFKGFPWWLHAPSYGWFQSVQTSYDTHLLARILIFILAILLLFLLLFPSSLALHLLSPLPSFCIFFLLFPRFASPFSSSFSSSSTFFSSSLFFHMPSPVPSPPPSFLIPFLVLLFHMPSPVPSSCPGRDAHRSIKVKKIKNDIFCI